MPQNEQNVKAAHSGSIVNLGRHSVYSGDCLDLLRALPDESVSAVVTDPPYGLGREQDPVAVLSAWLEGEKHAATGSGGFMGRAWDAFVPGPRYWREVLRVLKPGGHAIVFAGTRTQDWMGMALRLAGFEVRDTVHWVQFQGFPKGLDVSAAIDRAAGAERRVVGQYRPPRGDKTFDTANHAGERSVTGERGTDSNITAPATDAAKQWEGWNVALKPAVEPATLCRKPLTGTVAANVQRYGTGALNIDGCRFRPGDPGWVGPDDPNTARVPAVVRDTAAGFGVGLAMGGRGHTAGRFPANLYHCPKASSAERAGSRHPTVKPLRLMRWLVRLVTPPGGVVLDPFLGSGTTLLAAEAEGFRCIGADLHHLEDIELRWSRRWEVFRAANPDADERAPVAAAEQMGLFGVVE